VPHSSGTLRCWHSKQTKPSSINLLTICDVTHRSLKPFTSITVEVIPQWPLRSEDAICTQQAAARGPKIKPCRPHWTFEKVIERKFIFDPIPVTLTENISFAPFKRKAATWINLPGNKKNKITVQLHITMRYSRSNSTKSPASGARNFSEPTLMSQEGRMGEFVPVYVTARFLQWEWWRCQYSSD
jgi:hypothetical protein